MEKTYYFSFGVGHMFRNYLIEVIGKGTNESECYESARNIAEKYNYKLMRLNENYVFDGDVYE